MMTSKLNSRKYILIICSRTSTEKTDSGDTFNVVELERVQESRLVGETRAYRDCYTSRNDLIER